MVGLFIFGSKKKEKREEIWSYFGEDECGDLCCRLGFVSEKERGKGGVGERDESAAFVVAVELLGFFILTVGWNYNDVAAWYEKPSRS